MALPLPTPPTHVTHAAMPGGQGAVAKPHRRGTAGRAAMAMVATANKFCIKAPRLHLQNVPHTHSLSHAASLAPNPCPRASIKPSLRIAACPRACTLPLARPRRCSKQRHSPSRFSDRRCSRSRCLRCWRAGTLPWGLLCLLLVGAWLWR